MGKDIKVLIISELISRLEDIKDEYGDIPIHVKCYDHENICKDNIPLAISSQPCYGTATAEIMGFYQDGVDNLK